MAASASVSVVHVLEDYMGQEKGKLSTTNTGIVMANKEFYTSESYHVSHAQGGMCPGNCHAGFCTCQILQGIMTHRTSIVL